MLELQESTAAHSAHAQAGTYPTREPAAWGRTRGDSWAGELLDQLDHGFLVVQHDLALVHANPLAQRHFRLPRSAHSLHCCPLWQPAGLPPRKLVHAIAQAAATGLRSTLLLHLADQATALAVVPLRQSDAKGRPLVLLLMQREHLCTPLALQSFGRARGLTGAETSVLAELCAGHEPAAIAKKFGISLSTVRTQVMAMRAKLGAGSVREMLIQVARLPPVSSLLAHSALD